MADSKTKEFLLDHPKLLSALFGLTVLLSQMGSAVAANGETIG